MGGIRMSFLGGVLLGTAVGMVSGLLIAPTSGKQIRKKLKKKSRKYSKEAVQAVRQYLSGSRKDLHKNDHETDPDKKAKLSFHNK